MIVAGVLPLACALLALGFALVAIPPTQGIYVGRSALLLYAALGALLALPAVLAVIAALRARRGGGPHLEVLAAGLEVGDYDLIQRLFPNSREVRLVPLVGGYSGASVLRAQSWGTGATLQRASVVKVGTVAKLQPEVDNFEQYVREYVGNTATLLGASQRGGRMALRWAYAAFLGEEVRTLAEYAESDRSLVPVIDELFGSRSTLGLLYGTPRRDPHFRLYRAYSWTPRDWQRIQDAIRECLTEAPVSQELALAAAALPDPLAMIGRWCDPETGVGERADWAFDVPIATIHGDLNSRNIVLDGRGAIFVIDFAHAGPDHLLRDLARLEIELLLVLDQPTDAVAIINRARQATSLLQNADGTPCTTLRDLLSIGDGSDWRGAAVGAIRRQAHDLAGPWLSTPAASYLIALLHATLDTLRYAQCTVETRRTALLIAGRLCQLLD